MVRRSVKRTLTWGAAGLALAAALFGWPTCFGKPWRVEHLGMRALVEVGLSSPEGLTSLHMFEQYGLDWYSDELDDRSIAHREAMLGKIDRYLELVRSYDADTLDSEERLSRDALEWLLAEAKRGIPFAFHDFPLNQMAGTQSGLPDFMLNTHQLGTADEARAYVTRIAHFDRALDQTLELMEFQEARGVVPPRFVVRKVLAEMREFVAPEPLDHVLYTHFASGTQELDALSEDEREDLLDALADLILVEVYPAYQRLIEYYEYLEPRTSDEAGAWTLPGGAEYYAHRLRFWTSTDLTADQIHTLGRKEVDRIQSEMKTILRGQGRRSEPLGEAMRELAADPKFQYPATEEGRAQILADYGAIIEDVDKGISGAFGRRPRAPVEVRRVPTFKQETAPAAYYNPPALDGSRPGVFYANLRDVSEIPKYGMRTLAYHEAIPGHHFQIALALEDERLPLFRRVLPFSAFAEGWALYAEELAAEQGFQRDPFDRLGYLDAQLFRAVRLVVDTGIHAYRWDRDRAIAYMLENTGLGEKDATAEVERYIVLPGQACGYMVGRLEILRLRASAKNRLGPKFDLAGFHDAVLGHGLLPLPLLERVVEDWVEGELEALD